jgi:hypothetical protein
MAERFVIEKRVLIEINTDPQRRCYDGVHAQSAIVWTAWGALEEWPSETVAHRRLKFWRELNDYAVKERGKVGTLGEFRCRAVA